MLGVQCCGGRVFISSDDFATSVLVAGGGGGGWGHIQVSSAPEVEPVRKEGPCPRGMVALVEARMQQEERAPQQAYLELHQCERTARMLVHVELLLEWLCHYPCRV